MSQYDLLRAFLSDRVIAFHPRLAVAFGGVNEALIFQQLAYWSDKGNDPDGWIYKTRDELRDETTLTRTQQENARKRLRALGVIDEQRRGIPPYVWFRVNWERVFALIDQSAGNLPDERREPSPTTSRRPAQQRAGALPDNTKSTPKMTKEETDEWLKMAKRSKLDRLA